MRSPRDRPAPMPSPPPTGMMTTDTVAKVAEATVAGSDARVVGMAKGVGMIEPDMATHISLVFTDADGLVRSPRRGVPPRGRPHVQLREHRHRHLDERLDVILASGDAGPVELDAFEAALETMCLDLTKQIARDGEGANSLIEVHVDAAGRRRPGPRVAKTIVNSPLVKTAVHGGDPNWGRVAMAIGKCSDDTDIDQERVVIRFGSTEVYPDVLDDDGLARAVANYMRSDHVTIHVSLHTGDAEATVYGCDLSDEYVRFNADYTT